MQPRVGHRAGSDAVFLAAAVEARRGERILDVGAGVGVAGLCVLAREPHVEVTAVEIDPELCALATANGERNGVASQFTVIEANITAPAKLSRAAGLVREGYDHVIANPPFYAEGAVRAAPARAKAHVMGPDALQSWVRFLTTMAAPKGTLTFIHRPESLGELLRLLDGRFGDIAVLPLFPKEGEPAARVILQGRKGSRAPMRLLRGLVLHGPDGAYTAAAETVLRKGGALFFGDEKRKGRRPGGKDGSPISPEREESSRARKVR
ncbi:MAG: methyltransferase [Hyphomicrobiales bacterium]